MRVRTVGAVLSLVAVLAAGRIVAAMHSTADANADVASMVSGATGQPAGSGTGRLSVAVRDLDTGVSGRYSTADGHRFVSASVVKVDILVTLLLQAQERHRPLTDRERQLCGLMIQDSDNDAASTLWSELGAAAVTRTNQALGLRSTTAGTGPAWGLTTTTADDQLRLLAAIMTPASPLTASSRQYAVSLMRAVRADQRWGVSAAADPGTVSGLKNGWLPRSGDGLWVVNSVGEVRHGGHRLLIAVLSDGQPSQQAGISLVETTARAAAEAVD
ncbi:serine hydrolase [Streptomyces sp. ICBB 8177]|uniref:serine hydrolase n=1 Tax=Streptomyces sp. ICBB 8177 TaxID=563922 RepID=UPI000D682363|nr:serine hydrolase [Streptomyces sp. ICBB 8177]PWI44920.1 hypothetical protein CK485_06930 [Streptomyces sp. ICBB 8177]